MKHMINRNHIESILKLNGVKPGSPDDIIRSILMSARYDADEVDTALMVLRENPKTNQTRIDGLHKVFRTDQTLRPDEIAYLLGVDVAINVRLDSVPQKEGVSKRHYVALTLLSVTLAFLAVTLYMYFEKMGIFHHSMTS